MSLPSSLVEQIKRGRTILFLGSGALVGASLPGKDILLGEGLRDLISDRFLGGEYKYDNLAHVAAIAISQSSLFTVQDYIKDYFCDLQPAEYHLKIPEFNWRALFTTNYDRLIEVCYEKCKNKKQEYRLILSNQDRFDESRVTNDIVPLLKLHGCITRTRDQDLPLILTVDQYNEYRVGRSRLFNHLFDLAFENTIIFVGHGIQDTNIRAVLLEVQREAAEGQRHYLIKPGIKDAERDYWGQRKISAMDYSFEQFLNELDAEISESDRLLSLIRPLETHPIQEKFVVNSPPSENLIRYLTDIAEYVTENISYSSQLPEEFYRGANQGWFPIIEDLSIRRSICGQAIQDIVSKPENERDRPTELFVVKGEAGSGKSTLLREIAWYSKDLESGIVIWVKSGLALDYDAISEICRKSNERVFVFYDDAARNSQEIENFITKANAENLRATIITSERFSVWNTRCYGLENMVTKIITMEYLDESEIEDLIRKLEVNNCLGPVLSTMTKEKMKYEFREIYGRQLLVALHEATNGEPFEDIIYDEYEHISPESAKRIYLTVCTLHRLRIPVRAGLISRIHGISFERFKDQLFRPLQKVVILNSDKQDVHYESRHSEIAEIVFRRVLSNNDDRLNEYIRILKKMNISYESDRSSLRLLIRARSLHELFQSYDDVTSIYRIALESIGEDPYIYQQKANYERIRPNGNIDFAIELLNRARDMASYDASIVHSLAVAWRDKANKVSNRPDKIRCRNESISLLRYAKRVWGDSSYIAGTLSELSLDNLCDLIADESSTERAIDEAIRKAEEQLIETKRMFPSDSHIFSVEAKFANLMRDNERALRALERSFTESDRDPFIASRLAAIYKERGDYEKAISKIREALERRPSDHRLNFQYAEYLRNFPDWNIAEIMHYYRRAYTPGDRNYQAQFWHARYLFESEKNIEREKSKQLFELLRSARLPYGERIRIRDYIGGNDSSRLDYGKLVTKRNSYGFVRLDGSGQDLLCPANEVREELWSAMRLEDRLRFKIGFSYHGAVCCDVEAV